MDLFSATLLMDLSAGEVAGQLAERGVNLSRDAAEARCRQLTTWGNLAPSIRDARVAIVAESPTASAKLPGQLSHPLLPSCSVPAAAPTGSAHSSPDSAM